MVIKTLTSFAARPLLWFGFLALPLLIAGMSVARLRTDDVPPARLGHVVADCGSGVIFLTSAFILVCSGAFGELVYNLSGMREHQFARLTQRVGKRPAAIETQAQ